MMVASLMMRPLKPKRSLSTPVSSSRDWLPGSSFSGPAAGSIARITFGWTMWPAMTLKSPSSMRLL